MTHFSIDTWKAWAIADAERRGLHALAPLLEGLAGATARLRATAWSEAPDLVSSPAPANGSEDPVDGR